MKIFTNLPKAYTILIGFCQKREDSRIVTDQFVKIFMILQNREEFISVVRFLVFILRVGTYYHHLDVFDTSRCHSNLGVKKLGKEIYKPAESLQ